MSLIVEDGGGMNGGDGCGGIAPLNIAVLLRTKTAEACQFVVAVTIVPSATNMNVGAKFAEACQFVTPVTIVPAAVNVNDRAKLLLAFVTSFAVAVKLLADANVAIP